MSIEVKTTVEFEPWQTPNFARVTRPPGRRQDGIQEIPSVGIAKLAPEALDALAENWLVELYHKAGRPCPFAKPSRVKRAGKPYG